MVVREKNKKRLTKGGTRPPMVLVPMDLNGKSADDHSSLTKYYESTGKIRHLTYAQQLRARHLYLQGKNADVISKDTGLACSVIERLVVINGWDEERDLRLFSRFRNLNKLADRLAPNVDERHDRIAGTIETVAERILHAHFDGQTVGINDLKRLAETLKTTVEIRRTIRGKRAAGSDNTLTHKVELPDESQTERIAAALTHALLGAKDADFKVKASTHRIQIGVGETIGSDMEFEDDPDD